MQHLFIHCSFWKNVIIYLSDVYHFLPPQYSDKLSTFLSSWTANFSKHSIICFLPFYAIWAIWKERNRALFDGKKPSLMCIFQHIIYLSQFYKLVVLKVKKPRAIGAGPVLILPYGLFDGAAASGFGGAGFCLFLNESHSLEFALRDGN